MSDFFSSIKKHNISLIVGSLVVIAIVVIYIISTGGGRGNNGNVETQLDAASGVFGIGGDGALQIIQLSDITKIEVTDNFEIGEPVTIKEFNSIYSGTYNNSSLGEYTLHAYKQSTSFLIIHCGDDVTVVGATKAKSVQKAADELAAACGLPVVQ